MYYADRHKHNLLGAVNLVFVGALLILFGGLRDKSVGTDSGNYVRIYNAYKGVDFATFPKTTIEKGFVLLQKMGHLLSDQYVMIFILTALIYVSAFLYLIRKYSYNYLISVFVFITLGTYATFFNAARQSLAIALFTLSLYFIYRKRLTPFLILVFLAFLFHKSAIILLPFYFLLNIQYDLKKFIAILIGSSILFVIAGNYLAVVDNADINRYTVYIDRGATGGYLLCLFYTMLAVFLIYLREHMVRNNFPPIKEFEFYLKLCLFSTMVYIIVVITGSDVNFIRITVYFASGYILIWPLIYRYMKLQNIDLRLFVYLFIGVHLLFYYIMLGKMSNLIPYHLNKEIF